MCLDKWHKKHWHLWREQQSKMLNDFDSRCRFIKLSLALSNSKSVPVIAMVRLQN